jgi:hypothetical protein
MEAEGPQDAHQIRVGIAPLLAAEAPLPLAAEAQTSPGAPAAPGNGMAASPIGQGLLNLSRKSAEGQATEAVERMIDGEKWLLDRFSPPVKVTPFNVPVLTRGLKRPRRVDPARLRDRLARHTTKGEFS